MDELSPKLAEILKRAASLLGAVESTSDGANVFTVEEILRSANALDEDREKKIKINMILNELEKYYQGQPASKREADAQAIIHDTQAYAYLTLVPPRSGGRMFGLPEIIEIVNRRGITHGINYALLESACEKFAAGKGLINSLKFAECAFPERGTDASLSYRVRLLDKRSLFAEEGGFRGDLASMVEHVEIGRVVATIEPEGEGRGGVSVRGEPLPPVKGNGLPFRTGDGLRISPDGRTLIALLNGCLVQSESVLDVIPFYAVAGNLETGADIRFHGNVLVGGNVIGPVTIECDDLYVQGNIEAANVTAAGDIFITGGIIGKKTGVTESDGRVFTRFVSDATLRALDDVVVRNSITYSDVTTNGKVSVISERGAIVGGAVSALKGIVATSLGSDFGTYTSMTVGKDYLTGNRLAAIERRIREHEMNLARMETLKQKLAEAKIDISKLPPEKQDMYISVLQKEIRTREEMSSMRRGKEKFEKAIKDFLEASIRVLDKLHPPVRVQIGEAIQEVRDRMEKVTLVLDRGNRIMTRKEGE
ncbi:MAG: hypothetical protein A2Z34_00545 [Planctomycetes bacterium RBG_16_59_8]|nr:MAG: hypothetical protein A2Z34_00545 [Planctomycetes bacterium RBG_16_59_8]